MTQYVVVRGVADLQAMDGSTLAGPFSYSEAEAFIKKRGGHMRALTNTPKSPAPVAITGHSKIYRDLYLVVDCKTMSMEDVGDDFPGMTRAQNDTVSKIGRGNFRIMIDDKGKATVELQS